MNRNERERRKHMGVRVLRWIESQGVVFYYGKPEREKAKEYLRVMPAVLPELVRMLSAVYLYRQSEQADGSMDGILWRDVTRDGDGILYAVGLSVEAVERGKEYTQFLFIHELAHILAPGEHEQPFKQITAALLARFNSITESALEDEPSPVVRTSSGSGRKVSKEDQEARKHMRKAIKDGDCPPPSSSYKKIPVTVAHSGKAWRERHRH